MNLVRMIAPGWLKKQKVLEGEFSDEDIIKYNQEGYNIYYLPNHPKVYQRGVILDGTHIDVFDWCFVDFDCKSGNYDSKDSFIDAVIATSIIPTKVIDSGNGIHAYWRVTNLDAMSYLRIQRRLLRLLRTDEAVSKIFQLMRLPGTLNTKIQGNPVNCVELYQNDTQYSCEELDKLLPPITKEDEDYCQRHYNMTYGVGDSLEVSGELPLKFGKLLKDSKEVKELWTGDTDDRSKNDYRLGHLMFANGFTKEEACNVLVNTAKALQRSPAHRQSYANNIVDKIWVFELESGEVDDTVRGILSKGDDTVKGIRFPCDRIIDDTIHGFRLGQVIGIIGGSGVGKTTLTLNTFLWFAKANPEYHHFFFSLEQPPGEIAARIKTICQGDERLFDKIHIVSNYEEDGTFRHFSMDSIQDHLTKFTEKTGHKVGAAVIDHIGVLSKSDKNGEMDGLIGVCKRMKAVAVKVNCMLIMLSQAPREKAGIGDLELNKDAAFGTVFFESFVDYCICLWQPLKRAYEQGAPTIMAFKFAKIRHKKQGKDRIQEDTCYQLFFDPETELLREMTQAEEVAAKFYLGVATNLRKHDRKVDLVPYKSRRVEDKNDPRTDSN